MAGPFELDLRRFAQKAGDNADAAVRGIVIEFADRLIDRSPVGMPETWKRPAPPGYVPGTFKANWQLTIGSPTDGTIMAVDPTGSVTKAKIAAAVPKKAAGNVFYLQNCLPYAWALETGWSQQAPIGFLGLTTVEFQSIAAAKAAEARSGAAIAAE